MHNRKSDAVYLMGKPIKNTWDKIVPKILMASKFDATPYFSALCDGEYLEGESDTRMKAEHTKIIKSVDVSSLQYVVLETS